jgi:hypothetical protein
MQVAFGEPTVLPICEGCTQADSSLHCNECNSQYCESCDEQLHTLHKFSQHTRIPVHLRPQCQESTDNRLDSPRARLPGNSSHEQQKLHKYSMWQNITCCEAVRLNGMTSPTACKQFCNKKLGDFQPLDARLR